MAKKRRVQNRRLKGERFELEMVDFFNARNHEARHTGGSWDGGADLTLKLFGLSRTLKPQCKSNTKCWHDLYKAVQEGNGIAFLKDNRQRPIVALYVDMWIDHLDYSRDMLPKPQPATITDYP